MIKIENLALRTKLILDNVLGEVKERDDYYVIRYPSRPNYYWGNFILMKRPPIRQDFKLWTETFKREIGAPEALGYAAIGFEMIKDDGELQPFIDEGFRAHRTIVLVADAVIKSQKVNDSIEVKEIVSDNDWDQAVMNHFESGWEYGSDKDQIDFIKDQMADFKRIVHKGLGKRYGAYVEGKLAADLGIFWDGEVARFNNVATHLDYRRRGLCSTLVYQTVRKILELGHASRFVIEADAGSVAAEIYKSLGFNHEQNLTALEWIKKS